MENARVEPTQPAGPRSYGLEEAVPTKPRPAVSTTFNLPFKNPA